MTEALHFFYNDHLGSRMAVVEEDGSIVSDANKFKYDIWGLSDSKSEYVSYTGKQLDASGLYYFNNRYYDPKTGKFLSSDALKDGVNWYSYCSNNPLNLTDPTGNSGQGEVPDIDLTPESPEEATALTAEVLGLGLMAYGLTQWNAGLTVAGISPDPFSTGTGLGVAVIGGLSYIGGQLLRLLSSRTRSVAVSSVGPTYMAAAQAAEIDYEKLSEESGLTVLEIQEAVARALSITQAQTRVLGENSVALFTRDLCEAALDSLYGDGPNEYIPKTILFVADESRTGLLNSMERHLGYRYPLYRDSAVGVTDIDIFATKWQGELETRNRNSGLLYSYVVKMTADSPGMEYKNWYDVPVDADGWLNVTTRYANMFARGFNMATGYPWITHGPNMLGLEFNSPATSYNGFYTTGAKPLSDLPVGTSVLVVGTRADGTPFAEMSTCRRYLGIEN